MKGKKLIELLSEKGLRLRRWLSESENWKDLDDAVEKSYALNPFFSPYMQKRAIEAVAAYYLDEDKLRHWLIAYKIDCDSPVSFEDGSRCGIVAAGNIPAVAVSDIISAIVCSYRPVVKLSSKDPFLIPTIFPEIEYVKNVDELYGNADVLLTMGSDNAAESLKQKFSCLPKIVRGSRYSAAVLTGKESEEDLEGLTEDMLLYYGLGCRNVTLLFVPHDFDFSRLSFHIGRFAERHLEKFYFDNLKRERAIAVLSEESFIDGGSILYKKMNSDMTLPPLASVWYLPYGCKEEIDKFITFNKNHIQKIFLNFGIAQEPALNDYSDGIDVVGFLKEHNTLRDDL